MSVFEKSSKIFKKSTKQVQNLILKTSWKQKKQEVTFYVVYMSHTCISDKILRFIRMGQIWTLSCKATTPFNFCNPMDGSPQKIFYYLFKSQKLGKVMTVHCSLF